MIADAARNSGGGGGRDCGGSSDEGSDRSGRQAGDRRAAGGGGRSDGGVGGGGRSGGHGRGESGPSTGKRAVCKVMMRSAQLHAEHAEIGQRKEERRKVSFPNRKEKEATLGGEGEGVCSGYAWPQSHEHRPSHHYNAGMEHVGLSPTRQTLLAPSAKRRQMLGEPHVR